MKWSDASRERWKEEYNKLLNEKTISDLKLSMYMAKHTGNIERAKKIKDAINKLERELKEVDGY